jgi:hypothetical protein
VSAEEKKRRKTINR